MASGARVGAGASGDGGEDGSGDGGKGGFASSGEERGDGVGSGGGGRGGGEPEWLVCARDLVMKGAIAARAQNGEAQASIGAGGDGDVNSSDEVEDRHHGREEGGDRAYMAAYGGSSGGVAVVAGGEAELAWSMSGVSSLFRGPLG